MTANQVFFFRGIAALVAIATLAESASIISPESELLEPEDASPLSRPSRVRRQQYGDYDEYVRSPSRNRYLNTRGSANTRQDELADGQADGRADGQQGGYSRTSSRNSAQQGTRTRSSSPTSARQSNVGGLSGTNEDPATRSWGTSGSWGSGVESNGFFGNTNGGGLFSSGGNTNSGGLFGGGGNTDGGLFGGNRPSVIGSLISRLGQGMASTVQGVSSALANKWNTKVAAARNIAGALVNVGRVGTRAGLQAGLAHPRFAAEAIDNVF